MTGTILVVIAILMAHTAKKRKEINDRGGCPNCKTPVPAVRIPTSVRQFLWGGWTCEKCSTEMDRHGNELAAS